MSPPRPYGTVDISCLFSGFMGNSAPQPVQRYFPLSVRLSCRMCSSRLLMQEGQM